MEPFRPSRGARLDRFHLYLTLLCRDCKAWLLYGWNLLDLAVALASIAFIFTYLQFGSVMYLRAIRVLRIIKIVKWCVSVSAMRVCVYCLSEFVRVYVYGTCPR